ncbi:MAG: Do family serine endopeptidase [Elusimicrobiota bacterium]
MANKIYRLILILLCAGVIAFFWYIKDVRRTDVRRTKLASISAIGEGEVSPAALNLQESFVKVANMLKPAVVNISTVQMLDYPQHEFFFGDPLEEFFKDFGDFFGRPYGERREQKQPGKKKYRSEGGGSGVIIHTDGYILTNEHVIRGADEIKVTVNLDDKDVIYKGRVVGKDARTDMAIVKITTAKKLPSAPLGDSDKLRVGEWVIAIGSPFGLQQTVTSGIVSAIRQSIAVEGREYRDFIQTDAAINRGNSGGPLCNIRGEVIGINTAIYAPTGVFSGIGFAIPINRAKEILDDLIHKGKVVRGWLGIEIKQIDEAIQKQFSLKEKSGALINNVLPGSPAEKSGLKRGDVIIKFNLQRINTPAELQSAVSKTGPKKKVPVKIIREGKEQVIQLVTGEMPDEPVASGEAPDDEKTPQGKTSAWKGITVSGLTEGHSRKYGIPAGEEGVVVVEVDQTQPAYEMGIIEGDLIKSINRVKTKDIESFDAATKRVNIADGVVFDVLRQGRPLYLSYTATSGE